MVAAFCDKTLPLQRRARRLGEWDRPGLRGWQPRSLAPSANRPSSGIRSARIRVSAGYSSTRVQLSSGQHFHSCLSLTDFSNSELLKILKFPFMRSVHNMIPPLFFYTYIFTLLEFRFFTSYMIIAYISCFVSKGMVSVDVSCNSKKGKISFPRSAALPCLGFGVQSSRQPHQ